MKRKSTLLVSLVLVGMLLSVSGTAWAEAATALLEGLTRQAVGS